MPLQLSSYLKNKKVLIMGLGLHGGGRSSARFCLDAGANVSVTDLRSGEQLQSSLSEFEEGEVQLILGEHREQDFRDADLVIKNPAVPRTVRYLSAAVDAGTTIDTDIGIFLEILSHYDGENLQIIGVTGSKGKSSTASMIHHVLESSGKVSYLGGNITVSPLSFLPEIISTLNNNSKPTVHVVLELSSFQLGDLVWSQKFSLASKSQSNRAGFSHAVITNIFRDHQDYYPNMEDYVQDKVALLRMLNGGGKAIIGETGKWTAAFTAAGSNADLRLLQEDGFTAELEHIIPDKPLVPGEHQRSNMKMAAMVLRDCQVEGAAISHALSVFPGVPHRLEFLGTAGTVSLYNDSAATIPEAALAAVGAFNSPPVLITGGTDKNLELEPLVAACEAAHAVVLIDGSATRKLISLLEQRGIDYRFPESESGDSVVPEDVVGIILNTALSLCPAGGSVLLSPGCASFGLFRNEFHRGDVFVSAVKCLGNYAPPQPEGSK